MGILDVEKVVAGYDGPDILKGVSIELQEGKIHCIIGPNGAGKSTLLRTIYGILRPRQGTIKYKQKSITSLRPDQILRKGISLVPQGRSVFPNMSVEENLLMGGYTIDSDEIIESQLEKVYKMFPILEERKSQKAGSMSGGQQQMLETGRSLMLDPDMIMLDEPSLGLAPKISAQIFDRIQDLSNIGTTILMVEQNAKQGLEASDWGFVLKLGKDEFEGPADTLLDDPKIKKLYLGIRK